MKVLLHHGGMGVEILLCTHLLMMSIFFNVMSGDFIVLNGYHLVSLDFMRR